MVVTTSQSLIRFNLVYQRQENWPPLAWLANCRVAQQDVLVRHGADVETRPDWFCEAAWDGDFAEGEFDRTDNVFGSGGRRREHGLIFVSSASISDRLHYIQIQDSWWVSNSLVCLTAVLGLEVDSWYPWYYEDLSSICDGIDDYKQTLASNRGDVQLCYYRNLGWDGRRLSRIDKPATTRDLSSYSAYRGFLDNTLSRIGHNLCAPTRHNRFTPLSTCSSGYDSLAVTILARAMDNHEALCVTTDRIEEADSGAELVGKLGLQPVRLDRHAWRQTPFVEIPFIAADGCGRDSWVSAAGEQLRHRLLLTGHLGGAMWGVGAAMDSRFRQDPNHGPTTPPGTSLGEYRLLAGFLVCVVPAIGVANLDGIRALSNSEELAPWRLEGPYQRPLPRRIIEEAGISRGSFARRKTATAVHLFRRIEFDRFFDGQPALRDFMQWIRVTSRREQPPPITDFPLHSPTRESVEVPLFRHLFPWAMAWCRRFYLPTPSREG